MGFGSMENVLLSRERGRRGRNVPQSRELESGNVLLSEGNY